MENSISILLELFNLSQTDENIQKYKEILINSNNTQNKEITEKDINEYKNKLKRLSDDYNNFNEKYQKISENVFYFNNIINRILNMQMKFYYSYIIFQIISLFVED